MRDLDRIAALGIRTLRYPVLWERTAPARIEDADWRWADRRLERLRALAIRPIVGLVHHGSGPRHTSLLDASFADGLAAFAGAVAARYPWVADFTPVNEPCTTARFAGLYGHWYPHHRDVRAFVRALLVQCRATVLAMAAVRRVRPDARLVQTEDVGLTFGTERLAYQAEHENERRLVGLDLLCGRVRRDHPWWTLLRGWGATEAELAFFVEHPCPPDVVGMNYYVTSDRVLDERLALYPAWSHGGNERERYADVEAVRARAEGIAGHLALLRRLWTRYRLPLAITEVQMGCTREEQLRWLAEAWSAARTARRAGADVRGVTVWSLFGAYDWNTLVVADAGHYEAGAFDVRGRVPRPTAIARMAHGLATRGRHGHPVLGGAPWWRRPERLHYGPSAHRGPWAPLGAGRPLLVSGATGTLGAAFARVCAARGLPFRLLRRQDMDIADPASVVSALDAHRPWAIVNAAGYVRVDEAEHDVVRCRRENTDGPTVLAAACAVRGVRLVTFSSDLVFDGAGGRPYLESDAVAPLNVYGRTKAEAERRVLAALPGALVIRTSAFFGPWDEYNFVTMTLRALTGGEPVHAAADVVVSPTYVPDLVHASLDLLIDGARGLWHVANRGAVSWAELARMAAERAGVPDHRLVACAGADLAWRARRPAYAALSSERGPLLPPLDHAIARYVGERL